MRISIIVAMASNRAIGHENRLPWHLPADLKHFRHITMGKPIVMGRKTWESIGRPLPGRTNIVVTRDEHYTAEGCLVVHSMQEAMQAAGDSEEVMVIGGAEFYRQALPYAETLYLTLVEGEFEGDAFFPEIDETGWRAVASESHEPDEKNPHAYRFVTLQRVSK
jgi:dihydrofolate reductase